MQRILIVDDDKLILWGLSKAIRDFYDFPIEIKTIDNGTEALIEISSNYYDICILDVYLLDSNGIDIMKKVKDVSPKTRVIIMTAQDITDNMKSEIEREAYQFIPKPLDLFQVKMIIKNAISTPG